MKLMITCVKKMLVATVGEKAEKALNVWSIREGMGLEMGKKSMCGILGFSQGPGRFDSGNRELEGRKTKMLP